MQSQWCLPQLGNGKATMSRPRPPYLQRETTRHEAGPCGDLTFIVGANGRPMTKESFGNAFREACRAAGLRDRSAHGLRKAAATRAAISGATLAQLNAIFGWTGAKMALHYIETADRTRLSNDAMSKLNRTNAK
jgi:integrase